jgi:hypothetical protein
MSLTGIAKLTVQLPGANVNVKLAKTATGSIAQSQALAAAKTGTLSTRTNNTDGELTMATGHGITAAARIAIFWDGGCAYLGTVDTVVSNAVPFTGAAGDNLPDNDTAVTVQVMTPLDVDFDGDKAEIVAASFTRRGVVVFEDSNDVVLDAGDIAAGEGYVYVSGLSQSNPLAGDPVDQVWVANGDSDGTNAFLLGVLYQSDT